MFGRRFFLFSVLTLILLTGCAEPKYVKGAGGEAERTDVQESKADCQTIFASSNLCLSWYWEKKPTSSEMGSLVFKTYRLNILDQTPIEVNLTTTPQVILWMPSMGHGSTPTQTVWADEGTYHVTNVFFIMPGDWEILFHVKNGTEVIDEARISLVF